jgi:hypothetical protein
VEDLGGGGADIEVAVPHLDAGYAHVSRVTVGGQRQVGHELAEDKGPVLRGRARGRLRVRSCFCHGVGAVDAPWLATGAFFGERAG